MKKFIDKYYIIPITCYALFFIGLYFILYLAGIIKVLPDKISLGNGDAHFYMLIKNGGYEYLDGKVCDVGFFPLFPYFWKVTFLNEIGISILNGLIYLGSLAFLCSILKPDKIILGFFMSFPGMFFMFAPFSESLFFLFSTIILYGIIRSDLKYILIGALLASLTRASFLFFIPAFTGSMLMSYPVNKFFDVNNWKKITLIILACLLGLAIVLTVQFIQIGRWWGYFDVQSQVWMRKFSLPVFPLGRSSEPWVRRVSFFSFWIAVFISIVSLKYLFEWFNNKNIIEKVSKHELFSFIFISMSLLSIVFFNPKWNWVGSGAYNSTYLNGIVRYIFPAPFLLVFLIYLSGVFKRWPIYLLYLLIFTHLLWFMLEPHYYKGGYVYWNITIVLLMLAPYWFYYYSRWKILGYGIIILSFILQCLMFSYFLNGVSVD